MINFMSKLLLLFFTIITVFTPLGYCQTLDVAQENNSALGRFTTVIFESGKVNTPDEILTKFYQGEGYQPTQSYLNFGFNDKTLWLVIPIENNTLFDIKKRVSVETSWFDSINIYLSSDNKMRVQQYLGVKYPYDSRVIDSRFFELDINFPVKESVLLIRVKSHKPLVIPLYIRDVDSRYQALTLENLRYAMVYGGIISLILYNLLIAISIKNRENLLYALYTFGFLLMNISYTGYGYAWFWSESPNFQQWSTIAFVTFTTVMGLLFSMNFVRLQRDFLKLHQFLISYIGVTVVLSILSISFNHYNLASKLTFINGFIFTLMMILLGFFAIVKKIQSAHYFCIAIFFGSCGGLISCITMWGGIDYNPITYSAIEYGIILEAILLSLALADKYLFMEKNVVTKLANIDLLTQLNNRRALYSECKNLLILARQKKNSVAVLMIDLDDFKKLNDIYGHEIGDVALKTVGLVLAKNARTHDVLARWGGEEFIVVLPTATLEEAAVIAERIRVAINYEIIPVVNENLAISASIGVAASLINDKGVDELNALIKLADRQLYEAKDLGKNCIAY